VLRVQATAGAGIRELADAIDAFRVATGGQREDRRRASAVFRLRALLGDRFLQFLDEQVLGSGELDAYAASIVRRETSHYAAAAELLHRALGIARRAAGTGAA
jgi:putative protein kinase ArgK-like GTPase of G3E family